MFGPNARYAGERSFRDFFRLPPTKESRSQSGTLRIEKFVNARHEACSLSGPWTMRSESRPQVLAPLRLDSPCVRPMAECSSAMHLWSSPVAFPFLQDLRRAKAILGGL